MESYVNSIILLLVIVVYSLFVTAAKKNALQRVQAAADADETCVFRRRYARMRLVAGIIFGVVVLPLIFTSGQKGVDGVMIGLMFAWQSFQDKQSLPISGMRPHELKTDDFALYLRGFSFDNYGITYKSLTRKPEKNGSFSEARFISILKQFLPVYAVGMTKELCAPIGAKRIYLNDKEWEAEVEMLMQKARLIVILLNDTESCIWEIARSAAFQKKTVFILDDADKLSAIRLALNKERLYPLPMRLDKCNMAYCPAGSQDFKVTDYRNDDKSYVSVVKTMMSDMLGLHRWVFTYRHLRWATGICAVLLFMPLIFVLMVMGVSQGGVLVAILILACLLLAPYYLYDALYAHYRRRKLRTDA